MKKLDSNWIAGFTDGEGTFYVGINKNNHTLLGYQVLPEFRIVQHKIDVQLLYRIRDFFGSGVVRSNHEDRFELRIRNINFLHQKVIPFFFKYKLQTKKQLDFLKFSKVVNLMINKKYHLDLQGIVKIIDISSTMNKRSKQVTMEAKEEILKKIDNKNKDEEIVRSA
jgi:hypothetical protein